MLREDQEEALLKQIRFSSQDEWIRNFYEVKLQRYEKETQKQKEEKITALQTNYYLHNNADVMTQYAQLHFSKQDYQKVYNITKIVMEQDPYHLPLLPIHLLTLLYLKKKTKLFYHAHKLAEEGSFGSKTACLANFASACYYFVCGRWELARKYFVKSSTMDGKFLPALLGVGHSLSNANDPELALSSYRSIVRIFNKSPFAYIYEAMECIKGNELHQAESLVKESMKLKDTMEAWNELGVIQMKRGQYDESIHSLSIALSMCPTGAYDNEVDPAYEYILFNLATAHRKARNYAEAYNFYLRCMRLHGEDPSVYAALGLTCHLQANLHDAIEWYHKSMACSGDGDNFAATMLAKALTQLSEQSSDYLLEQM
jgi:anaphase-promoting complex subunit 6